MTHRGERAVNRPELRSRAAPRTTELRCAVRSAGCEPPPKVECAPRDGAESTLLNAAVVACASDRWSGTLGGTVIGELTGQTVNGGR